MLRKLLLLTAFCLVGVSYSFAQSGTIEGTITDRNTGESLPSTNIYIATLERGTTTNAQGQYTFENVPNGSYTLRVTYVGYKAIEKEVIVSGNTVTANFELTLTNSNLDQVVVTGYSESSQELSNIAVSTTSAENINSRPNVSTAQSLAGQVPGLNIQNTSGQPGANSNITIRGQGSINGDTEPLIILDGIPVNQDNISQINPQEIQNITTLKDAGATAIYGNRGANGVIVITTKTGSYNSGLQVSYSGQLRYTDLKENNYDLLSGPEQLQLQQDFTGSNFLGLAPSEFGSAATTNWLDYFFDPGLSNVHNLSISNGTENFRSFTSFGYTFQEGALNNTSYQRFNLRNNINGRSDDQKFDYSINTSINYAINTSRTSLGTGGVNQNPVLAGQRGAPYITPEDYPGSGQALINTFGTPFAVTPLFIIDKQKYFRNENKTTKLTGRAEGTYSFLPQLDANFQVGADYERDGTQSSNDPRSFNSLLFAEAGNNTPGTSSTGSVESFNYNLQTSLKYLFEAGDFHRVDVGAYLEVNGGTYTSSSFTNNGLFGPTFSPGDGSGFVPDNSSNDFFANTVGLNRLEFGLFSYFGTVDYSYSNRYGLGLSLRRDASYRFTDDNEWGTFYSISGRWNISNEDFMDDSVFNLLKLRASFGKTGNQNIVNGIGQFQNYAGSALILDLYGSGAGYNGQFATFFSQLGNRDLQWENIYQGNVGVDYELFNSRLRGSVDGYIKRTTDLFQSLPISAIVGQTSINSNNGKLENRGIDFQVDYDILQSVDGFNLTAGVVGNYNKQEVIDLPQDDGAVEFNTTIRREGGPLGEYYIYPYVGVNPDNGNLLFEDIDGNITENPTPADRRRTGKNLAPEFQGSVNINMSYKGVFLQTQFQYVVGIDRFDGLYDGFVDPGDIASFRSSRDILDAWTPENTDASQPSLTAGNRALDNQSDRFLRNSDFIRLRFASLGYRFSPEILEKVNLRGARVYINGENLFDITPWDGLDPQIDSNNSLLYPNPRLFTVGLDIDF